jgi:hypothetical protein
MASKLSKIIGDNGRGDPLNGSDGVMPDWSAHLDSAKPGKIISHWAQRLLESGVNIVLIIVGKID